MIDGIPNRTRYFYQKDIVVVSTSLQFPLWHEHGRCVGRWSWAGACSVPGVSTHGFVSSRTLTDVFLRLTIPNQQQHFRGMSLYMTK